MIEIVAFTVAGLLWLWVLVSTVRARDESRRVRIATYVALGLVVPVVAAVYIVTVR